MEKLIENLRDFAMMECILRSSVHAEMVSDMKYWERGSFSFTNRLSRALLWAFLGEVCLFIANGFLSKIKKYLIPQ